MDIKLDVRSNYVRMKNDAMNMNEIKEVDYHKKSNSVIRNLHERIEKVESKNITREELENEVEAVNKYLELTFTSLKFNVHEKLDRIFVQIIDQQTEELIREVPPEKFLDMIAAMLENMGLLIDERI